MMRQEQSDGGPGGEETGQGKTDTSLQLLPVTPRPYKELSLKASAGSLRACVGGP